MEPLLVLQNNLVERLTGPLAMAARERGIAIYDTSSVSDMSHVDLPEDHSPILVFGSIQFVHRWASQHPDLKQWVFWSETAQSAEEWRINLGDLYLNSDGWETTVGEAGAHEISPRHYRPVTTSKLIKGSVLTPWELRDLARENSIASDFRIWSSEPKTIDAEFRVWIIDGQIADYSLYRRNGSICLTHDPRWPQALDAAREIAARWSPARHFVCDVGVIEGRWGLVEFNPLHSSGWYSADPGRILDAYLTAEQIIAQGPRDS